MIFGTTEIILILGALLLGLFVPVAMVISLVLMSSKKRGTHLKKCPFCAEMTEREALVCRYCERDLSGNV